MTNDINTVKRYIEEFIADIDRDGWSGHSADYILGARQTLSHINDLIQGPINVAYKE